MHLVSLSVRNYCCYEKLTDIPCHQLTVFIGENDAGKSVLLDTIEILLTERAPGVNEYYRSNDGTQATEIVIAGIFEIEPFDKISDDHLTPDKKYLKIIKSFSKGKASCRVETSAFVDERIYRFAQLNAEDQKSILVDTRQTPGSNKEQRVMQLNLAIKQGLFPRETKEREINFGELKPHLPKFHYIASTDYKNPDSIIERNLQEAIYKAIKIIDSRTGNADWLEPLKEVEATIQEALQEKANDMKEVLSNANPKLRDVSISLEVDFSRSVTAKRLMLDTGDGLQTLEAFGEGTKKKLWMGILNWLREQEREPQFSVIRVYDEPDVNLDYAAERKLFSDILDITKSPELRTQIFVATHTITFVDRAPAESINLINVDKTGKRTIQYLQEDDTLRDFLSEIGRSVGISNSALFYERAFIVVEGESEEHALPTLYRNFYNRSMIEDGIVMVNLRTCGAWASVLKILQTNKADITVMLLDADCTNTNSSGYITSERLEGFGYPPHWQSSNCFYIGTKEFEDAFSTTDIVAVLNNHYPRQDTTLWEDHHIDQLRNPSKKFSHELISEIKANAEKRTRSTALKPDIARNLAAQCCTESQIPNEILKAFKLAREKAGCENRNEDTVTTQATTAS